MAKRATEPPPNLQLKKKARNVPKEQSLHRIDPVDQSVFFVVKKGIQCVKPGSAWNWKDCWPFVQLQHSPSLGLTLV